MASFLLLVFLFPLTQAQFGLFPGFGFPQPPPPPNPWANLFSNPFQPFQQIQTTPPTTTQLAIENVPNPDLERGNFPAPDPRQWPIGPDWNDPRNTWNSELGWGGRDIGRLLTQSSTPTAPIFVSTTEASSTTSTDPEESTIDELTTEASSTEISPIIRPFSQLTPDVKEKKIEKEVDDDTNSTKIPKILGEDSIGLSQMTSRQLESDRLVRHRSTSKKRH